MPTDWWRARRKESFYRQAKREGYRSRSAFKLRQINDRFHVMRPGDVVVDLGAAPGGWSQVAAEVVGDNGAVVAVDLLPMRPVAGVTFLRGDMTAQGTLEQAALVARAKGKPVAAVVSDMSPSLSGNRDQDTANSEWLCRKALEFAESVLAPGGNVVLKIFEGPGFTEFRDELRKRFASVRASNPPASEKRSRELYLVCLGWKGRKETGETEASSWETFREEA